MDNKLTDREYWTNYWSHYEFKRIPEKVFFYKYVERLKGAENFIEIGGFPGLMAVYFYKNVCKNVSILDYYIDPSIVNKLEKLNAVPQNSIQCIESDFFEFKTEKKYDLVFSYGFIEHFDNTKDVILRHVHLLSDKGKLLVILPNFRGLNGFIQYLFDRETYNAHNLKSMIIERLRTILNEFALSKFEVRYFRKPMFWLQPKPGISKLLRGTVRLFSYALKIFPVPCRLLSPYIIIYAEK